MSSCHVCVAKRVKAKTATSLKIKRRHLISIHSRSRYIPEHFSTKIRHTLLNKKQTAEGVGPSVSQSAVFPLPATTEMVKGALSCFAQWPLTNIKKY